MIRGINKHIIEVCEPGSVYFERAILFIRPDVDFCSDDELYGHAKAVLADMSVPCGLIRRKKKKRMSSILKPALWSLSGCAAALAAFFILGLL